MWNRCKNLEMIKKGKKIRLKQKFQSKNNNSHQLYRLDNIIS